MPVPVWQNDRGEFRRSDAELAPGHSTPIPDGATELLILDGARKDVSNFLSNLTHEFRPLAKVPGELQTRVTRSFDRTRGIDDHVGPAPENIAPQQDDGSMLCKFEFSWLVAPDKASR